MRAKYLGVLIHIRNKGEVGTIKHVFSYWPFQGGASYADSFCYLCFVFFFILLSCLFLAALWSPAGKGMASWLSSV